MKYEAKRVISPRLNMSTWDNDHWYDGLLDRCESHPTLVTFVCSTSITVGSAFLGMVLSAPRDWPHQRLALLLIVVIAAGTLLVGGTTERTKTLRSRKTTLKILRRLLQAGAMACGHASHHVRANIMLPIASSHCRKVDPTTAFNMDGDPDRDLQIGMTAGASGRAWTTRKPFLGDLQIRPQNGGPDWGLSPEQASKVRPTIKTVMSVPIFDPDTPDGDLIGTLQVDSDLPIEQLAWDVEHTSKRLEAIADAIALHLTFRS